MCSTSNVWSDGKQSEAETETARKRGTRRSAARRHESHYSLYGNPITPYHRILPFIKFHYLVVTYTCVSYNTHTFYCFLTRGSIIL